MKLILSTQNGYFEIQSFKMRRLFDLSFQSICLCLERSLGAKRVRRILDVGAGRAPYKPLLGGIELRTVDPFREDSDYLSFEEATRNETYDVVLLLETLEHVRHPQELLGSIVEWLKKNPQSELWISVPYGVRFHMLPQDYTRWTKSGLRLLLEEHHLQFVSPIEERGSEFCNLVARLNVFFFKRIQKPLYWFPCILYGVILCPLLLLLAHLDLRRQPRDSGDPLGLFVRTKA